MPWRGEIGQATAEMTGKAFDLIQQTETWQYSDQKPDGKSKIHGTHRVREVKEEDI